MWDSNPAMTAEPKLGTLTWPQQKISWDPVSSLHISMPPSGQLCPRLTPIHSCPLGRAVASSEKP